MPRHPNHPTCCEGTQRLSARPTCSSTPQSPAAALLAPATSPTSATARRSTALTRANRSRRSAVPQSVRATSPRAATGGWTVRERTPRTRQGPSAHRRAAHAISLTYAMGRPPGASRAGHQRAASARQQRAGATPTTPAPARAPSVHHPSSWPVLPAVARATRIASWPRAARGPRRPALTAPRHRPRRSAIPATWRSPAIPPSIAPGPPSGARPT